MENLYFDKIALHLRQLSTGGNWTWVNFQDLLQDVTFEEAQKQLPGFNSIAVLSFHIRYFVKAVQLVVDQQPFEVHDKYSFNLPQPFGPEDWEALRRDLVHSLQHLSESLANQDDALLSQTFVLEKYGTWHRNLLGLLEHSHYHMGQIAILKKLYRSGY